MVEAEVTNLNVNPSHLPDVNRGDHVEAESMTGPLLRVAVTGVVRGRKFPVVWVCRTEEWDSALRERREPDAVPWPAEDVRPLA
jgi:hypothetical protein